MKNNYHENQKKTASIIRWVANKEGHLLKNDIQQHFINTIKELKVR